MPVFTDQAIVVTGASTGIGRALCLALSPQRPKLVLAARSADRLSAVAAECEAAGAATLVVPTDVTLPDDCRRLIGQTVDRFGSLDALVNNAGLGAWGRFDEVTDLSVFERVMRVNYLGSVYCTHAALPHLKQSRGRLVAVASVAGLIGLPLYAAYSASKHAMFGFFDSLRMELDRETCGVTVTVVAPDFVASDIHTSALGGDGRPLDRTPYDETRFPTTAACARKIVRAMQRRQRRAILSARGNAALVAQAHVPWLLDKITAWTARDWK